MIERLARGEISKRAARDELTVSDTRINVMLAHIRGEAADPTIVRRAMDDKLARPTNTDLYRKGSTASRRSSATSKPTLAIADSPAADSPAVNSEWRLICASGSMLQAPAGLAQPEMPAGATRCSTQSADRSTSCRRFVRQPQQG